LATGLFIASQPAKVSVGRLLKAIVPFFIVVVLLLILLSWQPWLVTEMIK
jgi:TRAP-type C4-dicarboxylate transport system permease large subunit